MRLLLFIYLSLFSIAGFCQTKENSAAKKWADSVYNTLNNEEKVGQLIVARLSLMDTKTRNIKPLFEQVSGYVKRYNIGSVCIFQGSPTFQATQMNLLKSMAKTPILFSIDGEWGVGMRLIDSVKPLPRQMMLGAVKDPSIIYKYGKMVAAQCKRLGIQNNYAPVMDVNNNPDNPVINDRSFGEDKNKVATFGIQYMKGMQDNGIMACAKHFPGHGDVAVDSHYDLPVINKSKAELDATELAPFDKIFDAGIGSVMIGHLFIPAIDDSTNRPTSLSKKNIQGLMRTELGYQGITITDGLEMQGVKKFFPGGASSVQSIIAGNDLLCLPDSIPVAVEKILAAIDSGSITWNDIEFHCKRVLMAKYKYVLPANDSINLYNLTNDLNKDVATITKLVAENAITLLAKQDRDFFPLKPSKNKEGVAYISVGTNKMNAFAKEMQTDYNAAVFHFDFSPKNQDSVNLLLDSIVLNYKKVVIGIHQINRAPANNFGISKEAAEFVNTLQQKTKAITFLFGNAYAAKNWCNAKNLVVCYEDDSIIHHTAIQMLQGKRKYKGTLPVTVCDNFHFGSGLTAATEMLPDAAPSEVGINENKLQIIDSIATDGIAKNAMPGCMVLVAKDGKVILEKGYGSYTYENNQSVTKSSVYDLASLTKILSTTLCVMKLYDEGKIDVKKKLSQYLPSVKGTNKENVVIEKLLLHEAGLMPFIPYYKETLDSNGMPNPNCYCTFNKDCFNTCVANNLLLRNDFVDTFYNRILQSPVTTEGKYVYSDIDFIFLGKIVEQITGTTIDQYVKTNFYIPMGLESIGYHPLQFLSYDRIVPSTVEKNFRNQTLRGMVHDQGTSIMGGVAGHAGLFSDAYDVAAIMQLFLNGGVWDDEQYLSKETIEKFTSYQSKSSRRGWGFDKPEKDNLTRAEAYPTISASAKTFGHTGFTGTCAWADPESNLIFVFLSNRIYPEDNGVFKTMNIRPKIFESIYQSLLN
jgi:beta-glucosidase-like glycosyl hydrolase/CubicO group peptidase (beta-lactamase class C family)